MIYFYINVNSATVILNKVRIFLAFVPSKLGYIILLLHFWVLKLLQIWIFTLFVKTFDYLWDDQLNIFLCWKNKVWTFLLSCKLRWIISQISHTFYIWDFRLYSIYILICITICRFMLTCHLSFGLFVQPFGMSVPILACWHLNWDVNWVYWNLISLRLTKLRSSIQKTMVW